MASRLVLNLRHHDANKINHGYPLSGELSTWSVGRGTAGSSTTSGTLELQVYDEMVMEPRITDLEAGMNEANPGDPRSIQ